MNAKEKTRLMLEALRLIAGPPDCSMHEDDYTALDAIVFRRHAKFALEKIGVDKHKKFEYLEQE